MKFLQCLIFCFSLCIFSGLSAEEFARHEKKIYLNSNQVQIDKDEIFVNLSNQFVSVERIHRDRNGIYILTSDYRLSRCPKGHYSPDGDGLCNQPGCPYNR
jgi:hypothetical protein